MQLKCALGILLVSLLTSCTTAPTATTGSTPADGKTRIIRYSEHEKAMMAGSDFQAAAGVTDGMNDRGEVGKETVSYGDMFWVDGKPFTGLKVIVQGDAFKQGFVNPASECTVELRKGDDINARAGTYTAACTPMAGGSAVAQFPTLQAKEAMLVNFKSTGARPGNSEYQVMLTAMNGDASPATAVRKVSVWPAEQEPQ